MGGEKSISPLVIVLIFICSGEDLKIIQENKQNKRNEPLEIHRIALLKSVLTLMWRFNLKTERERVNYGSMTLGSGNLKSVH